MLALRIIGYVLLGLLALLLLLLVVPVRFRVKYEAALSATAWVLFVPIPLSPRKEKPKKEKPEKKAAKPKQEKKKPEKKEKEKKKKDFLDLKRHARELKENGVAAAVAWLKEVVAIVLKTASRLLDAITVTKLRARIDVAGEDAAQTALTYGKLCAGIFPAIGVVESKIKVKKQEISIAPAFCLEKTKFAFDVRLKISVWRVVLAALIMLIKYIQLPSVGELKQQRLQRIQSHDKEAV